MKHLSLIFILLLFTLLCRGQDLQSPVKVSLKNGEEYTGKLILNSTDIVIIELYDGMKFQIQKTEISTIEYTADINSAEINHYSESNNKIQGIIGLNIGTATAKNSFTTSPASQISLIFGQQNNLNSSVFTGIGIGYNRIFNTNQGSNPEFIPLFLHVESSLGNYTHIVPVIGIETGYSFSLNTVFKGGPTAKILVGISHNTSLGNTYLFNLFANINSIKGNLTENNNNGTYSYYGNSTVVSMGINFGLKF